MHKDERIKELQKQIEQGACILRALDNHAEAWTSCTICHNLAKTKYLDLFVIGSEGLHVCHQCEMELCGIVRRMIGEKLTAGKTAVVKQREVERNGAAKA